MKLLRTIRLDPSDTFVFDRAAEPEIITDAAHSGDVVGASAALRMVLMFECVVWNE